MNQIKRGQEFGRQITEHFADAKVVTLAGYSEADYPNVLANRFCECSFAEYQQRIAGMIASLEQRGVRVVVRHVTASQLRNVLREERLPNTPDGRAAALTVLFSD